MSKEEEKNLSNSENINIEEDNSSETNQNNNLLSIKRERSNEKEKENNNKKIDKIILENNDNNKNIQNLKDNLKKKCKNCLQEILSDINNKFSLFNYIFEYFSKEKIDNQIKNEIINLFSENNYESKVNLTDLCNDCIIKKFIKGGFTELFNNNNEKNKIKIKENLSVITESLYQIFINSFIKKLDEINESLMKNTIETENVMNKMALNLVEKKYKIKFQEFNEEMNRCKLLLNSTINAYSSLYLKIIEENDALKRIEDILDNSIQHNITDEKVQRLLYLIREISNKNELRLKGKTDNLSNEDNIFQIQPQQGLNYDSHKKAIKKPFVIKSTTPIHEIPPFDSKSEFNRVQFEGKINEKQILTFNNNIFPLIKPPTFIPTNIIIPEEKKSNHSNNNVNNNINNIINNEQLKNVNDNDDNNINSNNQFLGFNNLFQFKKNNFQNLYSQSNNFLNNSNKIQDFNVNFSDIPQRINSINPNNLNQFGTYFQQIKNSPHSFLNDNSSFFNRNLDFNNFPRNIDNNNNQNYYNHYFNNNLLPNNNNNLLSNNNILVNNFNNQKMKKEDNNNNFNLMNPEPK